MIVFGLHLLDLVVILIFLAGVLFLGWWASRGVKGEGDFFLGGRRMGRTLQFFLSFGNMTDSTGAPTTAGEVYRQGVGGTWLGLQTLFITPFYWFSTNWFRRARLVTMADLFVERLNSRSLATAYVLFNIYVSLLLLGFGNVISYKVAAAMITKPPAEYTATERVSVEEYREFKTLRGEFTAGKLPPERKARFDELENKNARGELNPFVSYIHPLPFYLIYTLIVAIYITLGGLRAAAVTDALQGLLILAFTIVMIPLGLMKVGGFAGLHARVPEFSFELFGTAAMSDYAWYSILAITFTSMIQMFGLLHNMQMAGSAKDENTARFGQIVGAFTKRLVIVAWTLCGILAIALLPGGMPDTELAWGQLAKVVLAPGLMGLMISGMLLGHMPAVGANAIAVSALLSRNVYEPLVKGKSGRHYLLVGQIFVVTTLISGIIVPLLFTGAVKLITTVITFNAFFGAVVLLIFFWRRLSATAVWISLVLWVVVMGFAPGVVPLFQSLRQNPALLQTNQERTVPLKAAATAEDVAAGRAKAVGEPIQKPTLILPTALFFDSVARANPSDPDSPMEGVGRFRVETFLLAGMGLPVAQFNNASIMMARWLVPGVLPFVMLIVFSYLFPGRRPTAEDEKRIAGFYAKLKTPVGKTPEEDELAVAQSYANPGRFDAKKLFPRSSWEMGRWTKQDFLGFGACWIVVLFVLGVLWSMLHIGA
jgi:SSS family solute:Na+ symporter